MARTSTATCAYWVEADGALLIELFCFHYKTVDVIMVRGEGWRGSIVVVRMSVSDLCLKERGIRVFRHSGSYTKLFYILLFYLFTYPFNHLLCFIYTKVDVRCCVAYDN